MSFFNRKTDTIDFQLTQHGKRLLQNGKFKPAYYSFHDSDVIYDVATAVTGQVEHQNDIQDRIKDYPRPKAQYIFEGIETNIRKNENMIRDGSNVENIQNTIERSFLISSLGNSKLGSNKLPAFGFNLHHGELSSSLSYLSGSYQTVKIPQLSSSIEYKISIGKNPDKQVDKLYDDGTYIDVKEEYILFCHICSFESSRSDLINEVNNFNPDAQFK